MTLRPYQTEIIRQFDAAVAAGHRRVLMTLPTGAGKTVVAAEIIDHALQQGWKALMMAHRRELVGQASRKLHDAHLDHGIIQAGHPARAGAKVQVASVQTLHARAVRSSSMHMPQSELVVVDEAHHVRAESYQRILENFPTAVVLGLTATPCRGDGRGLGHSFDALIEGPTIDDLIKDGYLVGTKVFAPYRPDLQGVKVARGDYVEGELARRMDTDVLVGDIVAHWHKLGEGRPTVVFATGVAHSVHLRNEFARSGVAAEHIDGTTPAEERDGILARLGKSVDIVCNCQVLTEGWDKPEVACIVLARPTKSLGLYRQMVGRVLRPSPGKHDCVVIDHAGAIFEHGFVEDPVYWTLREDRKAVSAASLARSQARPKRMTECPECGAARWQGDPCRACGWRPQTRGEVFDVMEGDLAAVERASRGQKAPDVATMEDKERFLGMLLYIAYQRSYKPGWAAYKYKEKFGVWPVSKHVPHLEPDMKVMSWVRSRQIAWAKSRNNPGNQQQARP